MALLSAVLFSGLVSFVSLPFWALNWNWGQYFHRAFGKGWLFIMGIRLKVSGWENIPQTGGYILAPNHESMFDIPLLSSFPLHFHWIAKAEVTKIPVVGWAIRAMKVYLVQRNKSGKDLQVMAGVEAGLKAGDSVVIFPEGTRTRTGELLPMKKGPFKTAANAGVPIIPVAITGTFQIAKPGEWPTRNHDVAIRFGAPFYVPPGKPLSEAQEEFRVILIKLLSEDRGSAYNGRLNDSERS